jgi:hypothetical protein
LANFQTHVLVAGAASTFLGSILYGTGLIEPQHTMTLIILGLMGGILPDIDSDQSTAIKIVFQILGLVISFIVLFGVIPHLGILYSLGLWVFIYLFVRFGMMKFFSQVTVHRGMVHSVPMGVLCGLLSVAIAHRAFNLEPDQAWLAGFFLTIGFLVHLLLDEAFSVDLLGARLKKSFGSAFTFFSFKEPWGYFGLYSGCAFLFFLTPPVGHFIETYFSWKMLAAIALHLFPA